MKSIYQTFLIILCLSIAACQAAAQNERVSNVKGQNPADGVLTDQQIINKFEKTAAFIKSSWRLIDRETKKPVYHLYLPTAALAKAGVKSNARGEAVPVYVQTADGGYEPLLTEDKGRFNREIGELRSGTGAVVTTDGFILTTRRMATGWKAHFNFPEDTPVGIVMSANLREVLNAAAPPPVGWIPEKTKPRTGTLGKFNVRVKSGKGYDGGNETLKVDFLGELKSFDASLVRVSSRHDVGLIKITVPRKLETAELLDNFDQLKKGEKLFFVHAVPMSLDKINVSAMTVADVFQTAKEKGDTVMLSATGDAIVLSDDFGNSADAEILRKTFSFYSYSGMMIYNNRGQIVGLHSGYQSKPERHYVVPVRYGQELFK